METGLFSSSLRISQEKLGEGELRTPSNTLNPANQANKATHGYLLRGEDKPLCNACGTPLTVAHVLLVCRKYAVKGTRYLGRVLRDTTAIPIWR